MVCLDLAKFETEFELKMELRIIKLEFCVFELECLCVFLFLYLNLNAPGGCCWRGRSFSRWRTGRRSTSPSFSTPSCFARQDILLYHSVRHKSWDLPMLFLI